MKMIRVRAAGSALVPDFDALDGGLLRFVGRRHNPSLGPNGGWEPLATPVEVPARAEYLQELRAGALEPADEATAKLAGVTFKAASKA